MRDGYDPKFLDGSDGQPDEEMHIAFPSPSLNLLDDVLPIEGQGGNGFEVKYIHYSLMMSKSNRQALVSVANVDNAKQKTVSGRKGRKWFVDTRIGKENQIDNTPYRNSPWDRGHLTRRTAVTWGSSATALKASNDSCAYTNAAMQHEKFNEDEWRVPEKLVAKFKLAKNDKLSVFTGPIFTTCDRYFARTLDRSPVRIPCGFWKMLSYVNKNTGKLTTDAYILFQDIGAIKTGRGRDRMELGSFSVTTTEIAIWTGLEFDQKLYDSNPLKFSSDGTDDDMGVESISMKELRKLLGDENVAALSAGIAEEAAIQAARKKMKMEDFYGLIEDISWV